MRTPRLCPREASNRACLRLIGCAVPGRAAEGATCYGLTSMLCRNMCRCLFPRGGTGRRGRFSNPFPPLSPLSHASRLFSHSAPGSPCPRGSPSSSQASRKACLHLLSSFLISNFLFNPLLPDLFCSVHAAFQRMNGQQKAPSPSPASCQPCPRHTGRDLAGSAEEPDGRGRKKPPEERRPAPPSLPFGRRHLESSVEGETWTHDSAPSSFQIGRLGWKCPCELGGPSKGQGKNAGRGTSLSNGLRAPMTFAHPLEMSGKQNGQIFCLQSFRLNLFKFFIVWD
ncbi:unnamed protein product [Nyctereutes procyonoides]|uniref:(raccoon dog) hypothetical protein n=1 Tax=Nyctereutes procyonoides TaxID=34880 RepID=A0A811ZIP4_NYCPR|nr:unnamed protein product [Nyctereutes procyonoides]